MNDLRRPFASHTITRAELLDLIDAELQDADRNHSKSRFGKWTIMAALGAVGWLLLGSIEGDLELSVVLVSVLLASLAIDIARQMSRTYELPASFLGARFIYTRSLRGGRPRFTATAFRSLSLIAVSIWAVAIDFSFGAVLAGLYFAFTFAASVAMILLLHVDVPMPKWNFSLPRESWWVIAGVGGTAALAAVLLVTSLSISAGAHLLTEVRLALLVAVALLLLELLARESSEENILSELSTLRRALVFGRLSEGEAARRMEQSLLGISPSELDVPSAKWVFDQLQLVVATGAMVDANASAGAHSRAELVDTLRQLEASVSDVNSRLKTRYAKIMWTFTAAFEMGISPKELQRRLNSLEEKTNRALASVREAVRSD